MTFYLEVPIAEALDRYAWLILSSAFLLFTWCQILRNHRKHPLPRKVMAVLIAYTVFTAAMLPLGLLSAAFCITFFCLVFPFFFSVGSLFSRLRDQRCSAYTEGTVTNIRRDRSHSGKAKAIYYFPTITFYVNEERYSAESPISCDPDELGKTCWVKYNPNDPHEITQEQYENGGDKLFFIIGIIFLCVALISFIIGIVNIFALL